MTFEEANELCDNKHIGAIYNFGIKHYESICVNCENRKECKAYYMTFGPVEKCNFYKETMTSFQRRIDNANEVLLRQVNRRQEDITVSRRDTRV